MIGQLTGRPVAERLPASLALAVLAAGARRSDYKNARRGRHGRCGGHVDGLDGVGK